MDDMYVCMWHGVAGCGLVGWGGVWWGGGQHTIQKWTSYHLKEQ